MQRAGDRRRPGQDRPRSGELEEAKGAGDRASNCWNQLPLDGRMIPFLSTAGGKWDALCFENFSNAAVAFYVPLAALGARSRAGDSRVSVFIGKFWKVLESFGKFDTKPGFLLIQPKIQTPQATISAVFS